MPQGNLENLCPKWAQIYVPSEHLAVRLWLGLGLGLGLWLWLWLWLLWLLLLLLLLFPRTLSYRAPYYVVPTFSSVFCCFFPCSLRKKYRIFCAALLGGVWGFGGLGGGFGGGGFRGGGGGGGHNSVHVCVCCRLAPSLFFYNGCKRFFFSAPRRYFFCLARLVLLLSVLLGSCPWPLVFFLGGLWFFLGGFWGFCVYVLYDIYGIHDIFGIHDIMLYMIYIYICVLNMIYIYMVSMISMIYMISMLFLIYMISLIHMIYIYIWYTGPGRPIGPWSTPHVCFGQRSSVAVDLVAK